MSLIKYNGTSQYLKWTSIDAALAAVPTGAWTFLFGVRHPSLTGFQAYGYLLSGTGAGVAQAGLSKQNTNDLQHDIGAAGPTYGTVDPTANADILYVASKAAGNSIPAITKKVGSAGAVSHLNASAALANQLAATMLQLGSWANSDFFNGYQAVVAIWDVELTQAQRIACGANWRTSDIWNAHPTKPRFLMELNVAVASLVNLGTSVIGTPTHVAPTLDATQSFGGWVFDGVGVAAPKTDKFFPFL